MDYRSSTHQILPVLLSLLMLSAAGCGDKAAGLKRADDRATVDSLVGLQLQEIARKSDENLSYRMTIEVKQKADSIIAAKTKTAGTKPIMP